jgi:ankyrin repeat protein
LGQLPATLFETYDRILASIPAENVKFARRALQLLAFDFGINTLGALVEAVIFDDTTCAFVEDDRFLSPKDILEICTCMITCDELRKGGGDGYLELSPVRLAHYSVKEYMTSERMKGTTFGISEVKASILAAKICVTYHLNLDSSNYKAMQQIYDDADWDFSDWCEEGIEILITRQFPLAKMVGDVNQFVRVSGRDEIINDLVLRLLNPGRPHFKEWLKLYALFFRGGRSGIPRWKFPPGGELTASLAYLCWLDLHPAAEILLERNPDPLILNTQLELESYYFDRNIDDENSEGAPLHVALSLGREWYVDLLVAKGADVNLVSFYGLTPLNLAVNAKITTQSCQRMIALLLDRKADPNPSCLGETPLQSAIIGRMDWKTDPDDIEIIRMLVDAGADVNATGNDEANIARIRYWFRNHTNHESIAQRGGEFWYKSPLLMIETQLRQPRSQSEGAEVKRKLLEDMGELLIRHGARSFDERPTNNQTNGMNLQLPKIPDFTSEGYTPALAG